MALTRSFLKSLGLDEDKIESVIEAHSETDSALNQKYSELEARYNGVKENADRLPEVQKELDDLKKHDFRTKYESEAEKAVRAYYIGKSIRGDNLNIAMRGTPLEEITLSEDGTIADTKALDALVAGDFRPLIQTEEPRRTVASGGSLAPRGAPPEQTPSSVMNSLIRGH